MKRKISSLLLCCLLLALLPTTCSASQYQISEEQVLQLNQIFDQLEVNLTEQDKQLQLANQSLQKSEEQIKISNNQINLLDNQLKLANQSIETATVSLEKVNKSFQLYQEQSKSEIRSLRLQRDLSFIAIAYMFIKK